MTVSEFVSQVVLLSEGKLPIFTTGSTKWLRIVAQGNHFLQQLARERGVEWSRWYTNALTLGTVTATDTYEIPDEARKLSTQEGDTIRITHLDDTYTDYTTVPHNRLKDYQNGNYCTKIGNSIVFNKTFVSTDPQFGGTITAPAYTFPETFSADSDTIDIDDPNWLVYTVASDRVKNDVTRKDLRADLIAQANEALIAMKDDNLSQMEEISSGWNPLESIPGDPWS